MRGTILISLQWNLIGYKLSFTHAVVNSYKNEIMQSPSFATESINWNIIVIIDLWTKNSAVFPFLNGVCSIIISLLYNCMHWYSGTVLNTQYLLTQCVYHTVYVIICYKFLSVQFELFGHARQSRSLSPPTVEILWFYKEFSVISEENFGVFTDKIQILFFCNGVAFFSNY